MPEIHVLATGIVHRNPKPHLRSQHAYFPTVVDLGRGEMLAAFDLGTAFEAVDCHTEVARSKDGGGTWSLEGPLAPGSPRPGFSETYRIANVGDGELVAMGAQFRRDDPEMGLTNPENMGFVRTDLVLFRSTDKGRTWRGPETVTPPLVGPSFEVCAPILPLENGRWLFPTSTWPGWDGDCPNGMKAIALVSRDRGKTWPEHVDVMDGTGEDVIYWEQSIARMPGRRMIAVAWAHERANDADRPNAYAVSTDEGRTFGPPQSTGLSGQTPRVISMADDRVLVVYRRMDEPGLWANLVSVKDGEWVTIAEKRIWGSPLVAGAKSTDHLDIVEEFHQLKFGAPNLHRMDNGDIFMAFWCMEDCVSNIRWYRLRVDD